MRISGLYRETLTNGNTIEYKIINGICYHFETPTEVCEALENARAGRTRIKIYLGTRQPYKNWTEEHYTTGYVGKSTGTHPIPLLVYNSRSFGGGALLDDRILKIVDTKTKKVLYQYANYVNPVIELRPNETGSAYTHSLYVEGQLYSNHKTLTQAATLLKKLL